MSPILTLKGTPIEEVESHCHLGIDLESSFTWLIHILRVAGKAAKCVQTWCYAENMQRYTEGMPRKLEYTTMVCPILEYGGIIFDGSPECHTHLDKVQREAALVCTGAYKHTKHITSTLMEELGWNSFGVPRANHKSCILFQIMKNVAPSYLIDMCPPLMINTMI